MESYGRSTARNVPPAEWGPVVAVPGVEESLLRLGLWTGEFSYPERPGKPDCAYYMRTGSCGFGLKCRYNHPRDRGLVGSAVQCDGGEYPERPGEPPCQFFLKTGTCKFGVSCKFNHPLKEGGSLSNTQVNSYGYPLRPGEKECSYYLKMGQCKFGITCKFHHPQLGRVLMVEGEAAQPFYQTVQFSSVPSPDPYGGMSASYRTGSPSLLYVPGAYGPVLFSPGVLPFPGWSPSLAPVSPALSPGAQPSVEAGSFAGLYPTFPTPFRPSSNIKEDKRFPEKPGQLDCQYYLKTGDCKFGSSCRYNHPPDWAFLGSLGLPLRPGVRPCAFYLRNGYCKFGRVCRFDHPVGTVRYDSPSTSSLINMPVTPYVFGSSSLASLASFSSHSELQSHFISGSNPDLDLHSSVTPSSGKT